MLSKLENYGFGYSASNERAILLVACWWIVDFIYCRRFSVPIDFNCWRKVMSSAVCVSYMFFIVYSNVILQVEIIVSSSLSRKYEMWTIALLSLRTQFGPIFKVQAPIISRYLIFVPQTKTIQLYGYSIYNMYNSIIKISFVRCSYSCNSMCCE